jgi:hypothetical protein
MHPLRLAEPEEDDGFFVYTFVTEAILLLFPYTEELWAAGFADALPPRRRRKVMAYYKSCLQRHLYLTGPHRTLLSKATQFCGSLEAIRETFPDARIVTIVRHPDESVASHVSVFYPVWRIHSPEIEKDSPESRAYAGLAVAWYRHVFETRGRFDPDRYCCTRTCERIRCGPWNVRTGTSDSLSSRRTALASSRRRGRPGASRAGTCIRSRRSVCRAGGSGSVSGTSWRLTAWRFRKPRAGNPDRRERRGRWGKKQRHRVLFGEAGSLTTDPQAAYTAAVQCPSTERP